MLIGLLKQKLHEKKPSNIPSVNGISHLPELTKV